MRLLYFHQHFTTPRGATGTRSYEFSKRLVARGHQVTIVCGAHQVADAGLEGEYVSGIRRGTVDGIDVVQIDIPYSNADGFIRRSWLFIAYALRSMRIALSEPCDLIFATSTPLTVGLPAIVAKWIGRRRYVFEVRDLWPELPREMGVITNPLVLWLMGILEWLSYRNAEVVIGLSPGIVDGIARRGVPRPHTRMIPNGCDIALFSAATTQQLNSGLIDRDYFNVVFCGAHGKANGLDAILDSAEYLKIEGVSKVRFVFIGEGSEKVRLQESAESRGLDNCVFHPPMAKIELVDVLASCSAGIMCLQNVPAFYYGTSPNKFFDYLAAGLPVLNNYPGWLAELVTENNCGIAVHPDNPQAFGDAIVSLVEDQQLLENMSANALKLADYFSRDKLADQFVSTLESVYEANP